MFLSCSSDVTLNIVVEKFQCLPDRFRCGNSKCIPVALLCDGRNDCGDNSDEYAKNCINKCGKDKYQCPNEGKCPSSTLHCITLLK